MSTVTEETLTLTSEPSSSRQEEKRRNDEERKRRLRERFQATCAGELPLSDDDLQRIADSQPEEVGHEPPEVLSRLIQVWRLWGF